jgi:hypothetical protein
VKVWGFFMVSDATDLCTKLALSNQRARSCCPYLELCTEGRLWVEGGHSQGASSEAVALGAGAVGFQLMVSELAA